MLGWSLEVYRQTRDRGTAATAEAQHTRPIALGNARWDGGLDWVWELEKTGRVANGSGDGYPYRFSATYEDVLANTYLQWEDVECRPDEWLLVVAWDQS